MTRVPFPGTRSEECREVGKVLDLRGSTSAQHRPEIMSCGLMQSRSIVHNKTVRASAAGLGDLSSHVLPCLHLHQSPKPGSRRRAACRSLVFYTRALARRRRGTAGPQRRINHAQTRRPCLHVPRMKKSVCLFI